MLLILDATVTLLAVVAAIVADDEDDSNRGFLRSASALAISREAFNTADCGKVDFGGGGLL